MFGLSTIGSSEDVPQWIVEIVEKIEGEFGFCTSKVFFKEAKSDYRSGCYRPSKKYVEFYFGREKTVERIWIVLHELVHAWQHLECPETLTPRKQGSKRRVVHNEAFFKFAAKLYKRYDGVLECAANNEYKRGRKYMV